MRALKIAFGCCMAAVFVAATSCTKINDYVLAPGTEEGWINIELSNPDCPVTPGRWHREFLIPSSGYACTSTGPTDGWVYERYWLVDETGRRKRLDIGKQVHSRSNAVIDSPTCHVTASIYWYGERAKITADSFSAIHARKPGCK